MCRRCLQAACFALAYPYAMLYDKTPIFRRIGETGTENPCSALWRKALPPHSSRARSETRRAFFAPRLPRQITLHPSVPLKRPIPPHTQNSHKKTALCAPAQSAPAASITTHTSQKPQRAYLRRGFRAKCTASIHALKTPNSHTSDTATENPCSALLR